MPVQLLAMTSVNKDAEAALSEYLSVVGQLMETAGAKILSRFELTDSIVGDNEFQFVTVIEYPDDASVKSVFDSQEYKSLGETKLAAFAKYQISTISVS